MTYANELIERAEWLEQFEGTHDIEAMAMDCDTGNLELGASSDRTDEYVIETIVETSIINGQLKQAIDQCKAYGLEPRDFPRLRKYLNAQ